MVVQENPGPPSKLVPRSFPDPRVARQFRDLETVCLKCLRKAPPDRYGSATEVAEDLQRCLDGHSIRARRLGLMGGTWDWCRRKPAKALLSFLLISVLLATPAAGVFWVLYGQTESARQQAETARGQAVAAEAEAKKYRGEAERLTSLLQMRNGAALCEQGDAGRGILLMAQSLEKCPDSAPDLQHAIRTALGSAAAKLHTLEAAFPSPKPTISMALSPDGRTVLLGGKNTFLVDVGSGKRHFVQTSEGEISGGSFSPGDGKLFVTSTMSGAVRVSETSTGRDLGPLIVHPGTVKSVAFSRDGKTLLVAAQSGVALRCYDLSTRQPVGPKWSCQDNLYVAVYSPVANVVATAARENNARLWDAGTGQPIGPPMIHPGVVFTVAFSPDGKKLVTGCRDGGARFWDVDTGKAVGPVLRHRAPVRSAVFSPDGGLVLTCSEDGAVRLWEAETGDLVGQVLSHPGTLHHALMTPDKKYILTAGFEGTVRRWRVADEGSFVTVLRCSGAVGAIAFSPDGKQVLTGCGDSEERLGESQLWDAENGTPIGNAMPQSNTRPGQVMTVVFSPDGKLALTGGNNKEVRVWSTVTSTLVQPAWLHSDIVASIAFSPNGKLTASSGLNSVVVVRDLATGETKSSWKAQERTGFWVWSLAFVDNETLVTGGGEASQLWRWSDKQRIGQRMEHDTEARTTLLSPDKQLILTCGFDAKARLWSARDGQPLSDWLVHKGDVLGGAFRPDGKAVATAAADGTLRLWEVPTGKSLMPPMLHDGRVQSVAFSPDGKTLATGCDDGIVRLWNGANGTPLGAVLQHRGPVNRVVFSPDGKKVLTGSNDRTARLWTPPPAVLGDPNLVTLWAQIQTGMELDNEGTAQVLTRDDWQERRRIFDQLGGLPKP